MASSFLDPLTDTDRVVLMEQAFSAVDEVCSELDADEWDLPTDCPEWSVKDNLSHLAHFEAVAVGRPQQDVDVSHLPHTAANDFVRLNEIGVEARRGRPGRDILEEFREVSTERVKQLRGLDDAGWEQEFETPVGRLQQRLALGIRLLDVFYHEQDIRRATGRPGHLHGEVARFVFEWLATRALPRLVSKGVDAPDGTVVVFAVEHPGRTVPIRVEGGRGVVLEQAPERADVTFRMDLQTYFCLLGGRWPVARARAEGLLLVEGDDALAERILAKIVVIP